MADTVDSDMQTARVYRDDKLQQVFGCPVCLRVMSSYIFMCANGHNTCADCKNRITTCPVCRAEFSGVRNYALEEIATITCQVCRHCGAGPPQLGPGANLETHQDVCPHRRVTCFLDFCEWEGLLLQMKIHVYDSHNSKVSKSKELLFQDTNFAQSTVQHENAFFIENHTKFFFHNYMRNKANGKMFFIVMLVGLPEDASKYQYILTFTNEDKSKQMVVQCSMQPYHSNLDKLRTNEECFVLDYNTASQFQRYNSTFQYLLSIVKL